MMPYPFLWVMIMMPKMKEDFILNYLKNTIQFIMMNVYNIEIKILI